MSWLGLTVIREPIQLTGYIFVNGKIVEKYGGIESLHYCRARVMCQFGVFKECVLNGSR
jgi:hypothetical protein